MYLQQQKMRTFIVCHRIGMNTLSTIHRFMNFFHNFQLVTTFPLIDTTKSICFIFNFRQTNIRSDVLSIIIECLPDVKRIINKIMSYSQGKWRKTTFCTLVFMNFNTGGSFDPCFSPFRLLNPNPANTAGFK